MNHLAVSTFLYYLIMMLHVGSYAINSFRHRGGRNMVHRSLQYLSRNQFDYSGNRDSNRNSTTILLNRAGNFKSLPEISKAFLSSVAHEKSSKDLSHNPSLIQDLAAMVKYDLNCGNEEGFLHHVMNAFHRKEKLPREFVDRLLDHAIKIQSSFPNVLRVARKQGLPTTTTSASTTTDVDAVVEPSTVSTPPTPSYASNLTVVGDVHGQYEDFAQIFENPEFCGGYPSTTNQFIFNGDLVDRGSMALEIVTTLLLSQLLVPNSVRILRGNHETKQMTNAYGFEKEVQGKYDPQLMNKFRTFFETLPIAAVIEDLVFVTHGGIGQTVVSMTMSDIDKIDRFKPEPDENAMLELLWSDPKDGITGFTRNYGRGGGTTCFGADVTEAFLLRNKLQLIIRSHEVAMQGYNILHNGLCVTVFSAPNYCGDVGNLGAVVRFEKPDSMQPIIVQFKAATLPPQKSFFWE